MKRADAQSMVPILRAYLASDSPEVCERLARRIAEFILEKSMDGHFGYFKLVLDLVDGKLHRTAEDEMTFEGNCVHNPADETRKSGAVRAA
jgi:hypothetical protein